MEQKDRCMSEKHYPYIGGSYDRIVFKGDGSVWVPEQKSAKLREENERLRELARRLLTEYRYMRVRPRRVYLGHEERMRAIEGEMRELGIEVE